MRLVLFQQRGSCVMGLVIAFRLRGRRFNTVDLDLLPRWLCVVFCLSCHRGHVELFLPGRYAYIVLMTTPEASDVLNHPKPAGRKWVFIIPLVTTKKSAPHCTLMPGVYRYEACFRSHLPVSMRVHLQAPDIEFWPLLVVCCRTRYTRFVHGKR